MPNEHGFEVVEEEDLNKDELKEDIKENGGTRTIKRWARPGGPGRGGRTTVEILMYRDAVNQGRGHAAFYSVETNASHIAFDDGRYKSYVVAEDIAKRLMEQINDDMAGD